jgi:putative tricarboxylic transport membrane protein
METLTHIINGFEVCLQPINRWYTFVGVFLGTIIGVRPGIGPSATIALLIPVTFGMNPTSALIMMAGVYYGSKYGGSTTAILIRTPGEASSVMTSIDGYEMARKGRAGAALAVSAIGSFIAGTIGVVALTLFAVPLTSMALKFGPAEYFTLMVFAMTAVASLTGKSAAKGMLSTILGLMIATIGIDLQSGQPRYTMGIAEFQDGVGFIVVVVGLFAVAEVFRGMESIFQGTAPEMIKISGKLWLTREEWKRSVGPIWRGGMIGFIIGVLPGAGGTIASILSYTTEKRLSKHPDEFGKGAIEGVAGPESANNAAATGAFVPMMALGIPTSPITAVMIAAIMVHGISPGPLLITQQPELFWGFVASMYVGNVVLLILNLPLVGLFVNLLRIPYAYLYPCILAFCILGTYSVANSMIDVWIMIIMGGVGYLLRKFDYELAPIALGLVLAPMLELSLRQSLAMSAGDYAIFVERPIATTMFALGLVLFLFALKPILFRRGRDWRKDIGLEQQEG